MNLSRIAAIVVLLALAGSGFAQSVSFDFEDADLAALEAAGWTFIDDANEYLGTVILETEIVHSGSQALRLGAADMAYFPTDGQFGRLDLWVYDYGWQVDDFVGDASIYGPQWGLRKTMDVDTTPYYLDGSEPYDHGIVEATYGIGAGICKRSTYLGSDGGYAVEWGDTQDQNISTIASPDWTIEPGAFMINTGWLGNQSWWSPNWYGPYFGEGGRPAGWSHWEIIYETSGQVVVNLLDSPTGTTSSQGREGGHAFDGTTPGGVTQIGLFGGRTMVSGREPELEFGDGIFDDVTWTPLDEPPPTLQADFDGDGDVDLDDFAILKLGFGVGTTHAEGDADEDGDVDLDDFAILKLEFGQTV